MIIRVKEANKHLKEQSLNLSGISSPLTTTFGGKKMSDVPDNISNGDMEAEIDDLRLQLEERDKEVKVSNVKLLFVGNIYYLLYSFMVHQSKSNIYLIYQSFQDLMYKLRVTEKSSRQRISNESSSNLQMRKKLEESDAKIERLNKIIQVRLTIYLYSLM